MSAHDTTQVAVDEYLLNFPTYRDYVGSFITKADRCFLRDEKQCLTVAKLGYRCVSKIYEPEKYELRKRLVFEIKFPSKHAEKLFSTSLKSEDPFLRALAFREEANNRKNLATIIKMSFRDTNGYEIHGYIDFADSLYKSHLHITGSVDWLAIFEERATLRPQTSDLSYTDMHRKRVSYNNSENFIVKHDPNQGLIFQHKGDHKIICMDLSKKAKQNSVRTMIFSEKYGYILLHDHVVRKKN